MMLRHSQYVAQLRLLATRHKLIQHSEASPRFARVTISQDPFQRLADMHELTNTLIPRMGPGPGKQVLVVESCVTDYRDNGGDNRQRVRHGALMVLVQVDNLANYDAIEAALDATEQTAEEIIGALEKTLQDQVKVRLVFNSLAGESIGPLGDGTWYGTRLDFDFTTPASAPLAYNPDAFIS